MHSWEDVGKTAVMKVLENYQKSVFILKFELSNLPTYKTKN